MTTPGRRLKLTRARAFALVGAVSVVALLGGAFFIQRERQKNLQDNFNNLASIGKMKAEAIAAWRAERLGDAGVLAESSFFKRAVISLLEAPAAAGLREEMEARLDETRLHYHYALVFLVTPEGRVAASAGAPPALDPTTLAEIKQAAKDGRPFLSDLFRPEGAGAVVIDAVAPITDGKATAVLVLRSDASRYLYPLIQSWPVPCKSAETLLVKRSGNDVLFLNDLRFKPGAALVLRQPLNSTTLPAVQAVLGHEGRFEGLDYRGVSVLADLRPIANSPWFLVAKMDRAEILSGFGREMAAALLGVLGLILLFGFGMGFLYEIQRKRAEDALRQERNDWQSIFSSISDMITIHDNDYNIIRANKAAGQMLGLPFLEKALSGKCYMFYHGTEKPPEGCPSCQCLKSGVEGTFELFEPHLGKHLEIRAIPRLDSENRPSGLIHIVRDITERKLAEEALKESEERFRSLYENSAIGFYRATPEGQILMANRALTEMLGYDSLEALTSLNLDDKCALEPPSPRKDFIEALEKSCIVKDWESAWRKKDGSILFVRENAKAVKDPSGKTLFYDGTVENVTERKLAEKKLAESEERFRSLYENSTIGLYRTTPDGRILMANTALTLMLGYASLEDLASQNLNDASAFERSSPRKAFIEEIEKSGVLKGWESAWTKKDGTTLYVTESARAVRDSSGKTLYYDGTVEDITAAKHAEDELKESGQKFEAAFRSSPNLMAITRKTDGKILEVNDGYSSLLGYSRAESVGKTTAELSIWAEAADRATFTTTMEEFGQIQDFETTLRRKDGTVITVLDSARIIQLQGETCILSTAQDITERKRAEGRILQLSRFYRTLSEVNQIVVRIQDREELLAAACRMLVEHGGFKMAWIGILDETAGRVVPEASAGIEKEYLEGLDIRWDDSPDGQGPIGRAIREKRPVISRDCLADPAYVPWRDSALARGYRTICALPIKQGDKVTGAFMVYHSEAGAIGEEEARLLEELANDLSFALNAIKDKAERALAEAALKANEERYRDIVENASDLICTHDLEGVLLSVNASAAWASSIDPEKLIGRNLREMLAPDRRHEFGAYLDAIRRDGSANGIMKVIARDGKERFWEYRNVISTIDGKPVVSGIARDVTERVLAKKAMEASEEKYRLVLQNMEESYYEVDTAGNLTFFNDSLCRLFGYTRDELVGMNDRQYTDAENAKRLYQAFNVVYKTGEPTRGFDWEIIRKDGTKRIIEASVSLRNDESGKPIGFRGIIRDVTEEKRVQEALRKSEEKYREMVESINDVIYMTDEKGVFSYVSPAISRLTDWVPSDLVGHSWLEFVHPEDRPLVAERMGRILKGELSPAEYRFLTKGGLVRWCSTSSRPVYDKGRAVGLRGVMRDITEQKRAEDAFRSFFENNPAASYVHTGSGQLLECNQAFCNLFGFASKEQALQASLVDRYVRPEDRTKFIEELNREKRIALREMTYKRVDGTPVHVYETVMGILDQDGKFNGAIGFLMDVTERKALEEQLRQSQKMEEVGQLAAGVAHDFNNVLMAIQGASELLSKTIPKGQPGHKDVVTIQRAADRAALITRQLLSFARKTVLDLAPNDPNDLVEGLLPMLKRLLPETIRVEFIQAQDAGFVNVDKGQMEQVIVNLCVNARDAMHKGGKLTLETENVLVNGAYIETHPWAKQGRYVLISVTDTGTGMKPEVLSKIFEPFFTTKAQGKGTGLGLSMAYGIVKQHEGMINAYSELGVGTTFKIYLPMVERRAVEVGTKVERAVTGGHETILVVEDDKEVRNVVVEVLMSLGYKVLVAGDGAEGLAVLRRTEGVSLVITDIVMPKMGGKDLRTATRQIYPALRFIFTSGYTQNVVHHDFVLEKGVAFLSKPYGIDTLARKVREVLDGKDTVGR